MRSKNVFFILMIIILLLLSGSIYFLYSKVNSEEKYSFLQDNVNQAFMVQLGEIIGSLSVDLEGDINGEYEKCIASVATAAGISNLSSYDKENDLLDIVLYNLYRALLMPNNKEKVIDSSVKLREIVVKLQMNPADIETTAELSTYVESLLR